MVKSNVSPAKLKEKPKFKLMDVLNNNEYNLKLNDFYRHDQMLGKGTYGEVCCEQSLFFELSSNIYSDARNISF